MIIHIDFDCVLNNLVVVWVETLNNVYGLNVKVANIKDYDITKSFPTLTKEMIYSPLSNKIFWSKVMPTVGSQLYLKKLMDDGHDVYIVTKTHYKEIALKYKWIQKYFPYVSWEQLVICSNKNLIKGHILYDDCFDNLLNGDYLGVLQSQPWNEKYNHIEHLIHRVDNMEEFYNYVCILAPCGKRRADFECLECEHNDDHSGFSQCDYTGVSDKM